MLQKTSAGTKADEDEDKKKSNSFYFDEESPNFGDSYFTCNLYKGVYAGVCFDISKLGKKQKKKNRMFQTIYFENKGSQDLMLKENPLAASNLKHLSVNLTEIRF